MKNILVPTDFSVYAHYAFDAAVQLAKRDNSTIYLYHSVNAPKDWENLNKEAQQLFPDIEQEVYNAKILLSDMMANAKEKGVKIIPVIAGGVFLEKISSTIDEYRIDMVIIGSHGSSGLSEILVGSNTQKVVRSLHCPVLIIKEPIDKLSFQKVAFASSFNESEKEAFRLFLDFVKNFNPEVHLVAINTNSFFSQPYMLVKSAMKDFKAMTDLPCKVHVYKDYDIDQGIENFAEERGIELIGISNHTRHPVKRMFAGSNVEALINHADVPVLSLDYKD